MVAIEQMVLPYLNKFGQSREVNVYMLIYKNQSVLIDSGYQDEDHYTKILDFWKSVGQPPVRCILLTHAHVDHIGGAKKLREVWDAPIGLHVADVALLREYGFTWQPDFFLQDGPLTHTSARALDIIHTPGHTPGHVCIFLKSKELLFSGDSIFANTSTLIRSPHGSMSQYLKSLRALLKWPIKQLAPGHGGMLKDDGWHRIVEVLEQRLRREGEILSLIRLGHHTINDIATALYQIGSETPIHAMRCQLIESHLLHLVNEGYVLRDGDTWVLTKR